MSEITRVSDDENDWISDEGGGFRLNLAIGKVEIAVYPDGTGEGSFYFAGMKLAEWEFHSDSEDAEEAKKAASEWAKRILRADPSVRKII